MTKQIVLIGILSAAVLAPASVRVHAQAPQTTPQETNLMEAINSHPQYVAGYLDLAKYYVSMGRYEEARAQLVKAGALLDQLQAGTLKADGSNVTPIRMPGNVVPPTRVKNVDPIYPVDAMRSRVSGIVKIEATISAEGKVISARVVQSVPMLDQAALDAVKQWEYSPTLLGGVPVPIIMTVTVSFQHK